MKLRSACSRPVRERLTAVARALSTAPLCRHDGCAVDERTVHHGGAALWGGRARYRGHGRRGTRRAPARARRRSSARARTAGSPEDKGSPRTTRARTGEQGEGRDHACLFAGGKAGELVEISEISRSPAARGVQREQGRKNSKGAPAFGEPARTARRRCHDQSGGSCATSDPHGEAVVAVFARRPGAAPRLGRRCARRGARPQRTRGRRAESAIRPARRFRLDGALELGVRLAKPQGDLTARGVIEDDDGLDDPLDSGTAPAAQQAGRVAGLADRRVPRAFNTATSTSGSARRRAPVSSRYSSMMPASAASARRVAGMRGGVATIVLSPTR